MKPSVRLFSVVTVSVAFFTFALPARAATQIVFVGSGGNNFTPANVTILPGDSVEWHWSTGGHSTTSGSSGSPNGIWDSGVQGAGFVFSHTFSTPGSFPYYCTPHGCCGMVGSVNVTAPTATPTPIPKGPVRVQLREAAAGLTAPGGMVSPNDGSGRSFIVQQTGQVLIYKNGAVSPTPFLNVASRLVVLSPGYDERGLLGFEFHPDFNNPSAPGYRKVYTYTSEPVSGTADFTVPGTSFNNQSVIAEWRVSSGNPDAIDPATRREIMRIDHPQSNHNAGELGFRPADHYLYIATGDGGNANDVGPGHNPTTGNGQDRSTVLGKILRIDPLDPALTTGSADAISANGKYRIPQSNPFVSQSGVVKEIYAYGLRNPYRFSFDAASDRFIVGDVGQNSIEELDFGAAGNNFGWNKKEGSYLFNPATGSVTPDTAPDPTLINPFAEYSHSDGTAVIGGFIYRGVLVPALAGKYVFGDLAQGTNGRLFYTDPGDGIIRELRLGLPETSLGLYIKGFGLDKAGEFYALVDSNVGPSGTTGKLLKLTTIQPATAVSRKMHGGIARDINLLTTTPAIECRSGGATNDYQIVLTFPSAVTFSGATVTPGSGGSGSLAHPPSSSPDGKTVTVDVTNVSNAQTLTVTLTSVNDGTNTFDVSTQMAVLIGDTTGDETVNSADIAQTKSQSGQAVSGTNFREDVTVDGNVNSADIALVKSKSGTALP